MHTPTSLLFFDSVKPFKARFIICFHMVRPESLIKKKVKKKSTGKVKVKKSQIEKSKKVKTKSKKVDQKKFKKMK